MIKCEECHHRTPDIPFVFQYLDAEHFEITSERRTCKACWERLRGNVRIISHGPRVRFKGKRYERVTVVGEAIKYQGELF